MALKNTTKLDTGWLKELAEAVRPSGLKQAFDIRVTDTKWGSRAVAYTRGSGYHATARSFVNLRISEREKYPHTFEAKARRKGYLGGTVYSIFELAVFLMAHEIRHLWQEKHPRGSRVWGARGKLSERDADAYAIQAVRRYRRGELACGPGRLTPVPTEDERAAELDERKAKRKAAKDAHVRAQVAKWQRKVKLAKTMLRKWEAKLKRIEKVAAKREG
jgi:hypothetical protein